MGRHTEMTGHGTAAVKLPQPYTYTGRHRAEDREGATPAVVERPPSPGYSFTLVEQPGGES